MSHPNGQGQKGIPRIPIGIQVPKSPISRRKNPILFLSRGFCRLRIRGFPGISEHSPSFQGDPAFPRCPRRPGGRRGAGIATTGGSQRHQHSRWEWGRRNSVSNLFIPPSLLGVLMDWDGSMEAFHDLHELTLQDLPLNLGNCPNSKQPRPNLGLPRAANSSRAPGIWIFAGVGKSGNVISSFPLDIGARPGEVCPQLSGTFSGNVWPRRPHSQSRWGVFPDGLGHKIPIFLRDSHKFKHGPRFRLHLWEETKTSQE